MSGHYDDYGVPEPSATSLAIALARLEVAVNALGRSIDRDRADTSRDLEAIRSQVVNFATELDDVQSWRFKIIGGATLAAAAAATIANIVAALWN